MKALTGGLKRGLASSAARAVEVGRRSAEGDLRVEAENARREGVPLLLPVEAVGARPSEDLRPVDEGHVGSLVESIRALGLMQPICVDREHRLVAGAHRLAAYRRLAAEDPARWGRVPVVVDPDLDAAEDPERALLKELAENEKRRDLTPAQVQDAARRLMAFDASFTRRAGRLREGERPVTPFLAEAFGVSVRHVRSLLNAPQGGEPSGEPAAPAEVTAAPGAGEVAGEPSAEVARLAARRRVSRAVGRFLADPALAGEEALLRGLREVLRAAGG